MNEKAPGLDGLTAGFWKSLDNQYIASKNDQRHKRKCNTISILAQVFQDIHEHGMDEMARLNEGCMSPIYKKKDLEDVVNYCPITLLNTDHKILTKTLSIRLVDVVLEIINTDQAGFIKRRSIFDQVKTTKLVINYMSRLSRKGTIMALNQEKAYDKILHPYL